MSHGGQRRRNLETGQSTSPPRRHIRPITLFAWDRPVVIHDAGVRSAPHPCCGEAHCSGAHGRARHAAAPVQKEVHPCTRGSFAPHPWRPRSCTVRLSSPRHHRRRHRVPTSTTRRAGRRRSPARMARSRHGCRTSAPTPFRSARRSASTQRFINQGLNLAYAFNHAEARRAFREAARLSPNLAMAYWGQALVLGPNINALMEPNDEPHALELVKKAQSLKGTAHAARARADRRTRRALLRHARSPHDQRSRVRRGDAQGAPALPRRPRHRDALRRVDDGPAALGLLDARRATARRHGGDRRAHRTGDRAGTRNIRAPCTCTST